MNRENTHKPKTSSRGRKVFDVVRPNQVLATPSSRPIITNRSPHIRDDQLVKDPDLVAMVVPSSSMPADAMALMTHKHVGLKPLVEPLPAAAPSEEEPESEPASEPDTEPAPESQHLPVDNSLAYGGSAFGPAPVGETKAVPEAPQPTVPQPEVAQPSVEGLAVKNTVEVATDQPVPVAQPQPAVAPVPATQSAAGPQAQQPLADIEALPAEDMPVSDEFDVGKAIVSHHQQSSNNTALLLFLLLIVLTLIVVDVLLDAGLIPNGYNLPHTNLIN